MEQSPAKENFLSALCIADVRLFIASVACFTLASRALLVVIGFQIYQMTKSALSLGLLGLAEAIPALSLVLIGGYVADHYDRRRILLITRFTSCLCAIALSCLSLQQNHASLLGLYAVIFLAGIARAFADPANSAFEAQIVPRHLTVNGASWISSAWVSCYVIGPAAIGFIFAAHGAVASYIVISIFFALSFIFTLRIAPKEQPKPQNNEPLLKSIALGWDFVFSHQPLWGAMALDLFAVLFGGVIALLPIYATDILNVGASGLGILNAATALGALITMLCATHFAKHIIHHAGRNLMLAVVGFGLSILVFAFSTNFWLSLSMLFLSGIFDGISMVIRRSMVRLLSPDHMRGRIASVNWIFICSSNELGAFQSGMMAAWLGTVPSVAVGGLLTLGVVSLMAMVAPKLRQLRFND